ncbi:response regulator transcription factor [Streptomyces yaizuensis]|uniref:Response regulator transcription factor n=1 Tax=Streptomyces yaizuensis TaxID=2989713 RepID=A0ABQ5NRJ6_9ACTN|nr:response regulator transcription factor [Streptomyces sp. YSPA8]GLF92955.1 response regulator transcription factor [Streptomyces sp. YSPA8]
MTSGPSTAASLPYRVLVVEDDDSIRTLLESVLGLTGYTVASVGSGRAALLEAQRFAPDLIMLDVMLPDLDGFEVTRTLRAAGNGTPVLFLTARANDTVTGLRAGGDDYVVKPFGIEEVLLRVAAILRRTADGPHQASNSGAEGEEKDVLLFADLRLDRSRHEVHRAGEHIPLSPTEFDLLAYLMTNAGRVLRRIQIVEHVWHYDFAGDTRIIETYVKYLRRKIDRFDPPLIHTVRGVGYTLRLPRDQSAPDPRRPR